MPFIALHRETKQKIDISEIENPRAVLKSGDWVCQLCNKPLIIKAGFIVAAHFAHYAGECTSDYKAHPESPEHRFAKKKLATLLTEKMGEYSDAFVDYEVRVPEVNRVADVMAVFPMGWRVVHEVQLASTTSEELEQRSNDYNRAGIDVVWWLGKNADTPGNRAWCIRTFGYSLRIAVLTEEASEPLEIGA
jgi:competence protein CoiA